VSYEQPHLKDKSRALLHKVKEAQSSWLRARPLEARASKLGTLFLKQILKRLPRIAGFLCLFAGRFLFQPHTNREKRTAIAFVFGRDPLRNGLVALEPARWIEVLALLAGVQLKPAFRALPERLAQIFQNCAALGAA